MRSLGFLLGTELKKGFQPQFPLVVAREAIWRARKILVHKRVQASLRRDVCDVRVRYVEYFVRNPDLCNAAARATIVGLADFLVDGKFPFLSYPTAPLGIAPDWNRDFVSGKGWPHIHASGIKIIRHDGSDVKVPWELSRLQFLPVLAKAHVLTGEQRYRDTAKRLVSDWIEENPVGVGVNWTIAMEAALRAISICLTLDLLWPLRQDEQPWLEKVTHSLWQHLLFIEGHSEFSHFTRSNHYLSNIVGLLCLSTFLQGPRMERRRKHYQRRVEQEILHQTYEDGGDYEASTGYHVLVTQMFTCALLLIKAAGAQPAKTFLDRLRKMYSFAAALADSEGRIPHVGDCDDGRVELLLDDLEQMLTLPIPERHSLAVSSFLGTGSALFGDFYAGRLEDAAWYGLLPPGRTAKLRVPSPARSQNPISVFPRSGVAVAHHGKWGILFFAMPNGVQGRGSHTHNDKLSLVVRLDGEELFSDSGTGVYTRDAATRNHFRSTAAHNTMMVDGLEQNRISQLPEHLFLLGNEAEVTPIQGRCLQDGLVLNASHRGYGQLNIVHSRRLTATENTLLIEDTIEGTGEHEFLLNFHVPSDWKVEHQQSQGKVVSCRLHKTSLVSLVVSAPIALRFETEPALRSRSYGSSSLLATCLRVSGRAALPLVIVTKVAS